MSELPTTSPTRSPATDVIPPYVCDAADVVAELGSDAADGLATTEAAARLSTHGPNAITDEEFAALKTKALA